MSSVSELNASGFGRFGGVVGECEVDGLGAGGAFRWILHCGERFGEGRVTEVGFAFVTVHAVEKGGDFKKLETRVHEVEVLDFLFRGHGLVGLLGSSGDVLVEIRVELGEGLAELVELGFRAVDLDAVEFGKGQGFLDAGAHVFEVAEDTGGADVGLAAKNLVATK